MTSLRRNCLNSILSEANVVHPGLWLSRGLASYPESKRGGDAAGQVKSSHIKKLSEFASYEAYRLAYNRWESITRDSSRFSSCHAKLEGRLYIGVSRENALETGVTVSHTYGMPMIPGSAVKGACRSAASDWEMDESTLQWVFGHAGKSHDNDLGQGGGLIFHDAWWIPEGKPFVPEIITVHHQEYYGSEGKNPATDFDSPIPAPQIAVQGSFYFVVEGSPVIAKPILDLLSVALSSRGIGAKRSSGYGYFNPT